MKVKATRNMKCPCLSGKKVKNCCGRPGAKVKGKQENTFGFVFAAVAGGVILLILILKITGKGNSGSGSEPPGPAPPGKVWSSEHGHWHDAF